MRSILLPTVLVVGLIVMTGTGVASPGEAADSDGPPDTLPDPVPNFVSDLLDTINDFIAGAIDSLGSTVRQITPN